MSEKAELGKKKWTEVMGPKTKDTIAAFETVSPDFARYLEEFCWGEIYQRKGLEDKTRVAIAFGALVGKQDLGIVMQRYIRAMLNVGWTKDEIIEMIIFLIPYLGFGSAGNALYVAQEVFSGKEYKPKA
ncbi:MAG: carboxymuconolactone decarboxylase family protein [Gammaproteobacteria bacterium]|nr:carboxymuconolactone decarboxylase family protein [Gammaproteobacteria bacterium]